MAGLVGMVWDVRLDLCLGVSFYVNMFSGHCFILKFQKSYLWNKCHPSTAPCKYNSEGEGSSSKLFIAIIFRDAAIFFPYFACYLVSLPNSHQVQMDQYSPFFLSKARESSRRTHQDGRSCFQIHPHWTSDQGDKFYPSWPDIYNKFNIFCIGTG